MYYFKNDECVCKRIILDKNKFILIIDKPFHFQADKNDYLKNDNFFSKETSLIRNPKNLNLKSK